MENDREKQREIERSRVERGEKIEADLVELKAEGGENVFDRELYSKKDTK